MEVSNRCDYAFRILSVAYRKQGEFVSIATIAEEEDIPYSFARSIQHDLVKAGFLKTARGVKGGLTLACDPTEVTLKDVFEAMQGEIMFAPCSGTKTLCPRCGGCVFHAVWEGVGNVVSTYLDSITLDEVMKHGASHPVVREMQALTYA